MEEERGKRGGKEGPKHIAVTTSIFQGHVKSSISWSFDSYFAIDGPLEPSFHL